MFRDMEVEEQISYLRGCLPLNQFEQVTSQHQTYSEETVEELIQEGKDVLQLQMQEGRDHWEYLKENSEVIGDQGLMEKSYRELLYYFVSMGNSLLETYPVPFSFNEGHEISELIEDGEHTVESLRTHIIEEGGEGSENALSEMGRNIWSVIEEYPQIRFIYFEDKDHIYFEFWVKASEDREFHERKGEFVEFPDIRKIDCRLHLDDNVIELRGRSEREKDRERVLNYVERIFGNSTALTVKPEDIDITDDTIRHFMNLPEFVTIPHASKAGTADSNWTSDSDVRDDDEYPDHRPHNYGNMVFNLDTVGRVSFQLSADDNSFRIFKHKTTPEEHQQIVDYIWENTNAANN